MTAPNIVAVSTITGKTAALTPTNTTANILIANSAGSGQVFKINSIMVANIDGTSTYSSTVAYNTSAGGSGTSYALASTISIPANASLIVVDKSTSFYLEENTSLLVTSSTASKLTFVVGYEIIS